MFSKDNIIISVLLCYLTCCAVVFDNVEGIPGGSGGRQRRSGAGGAPVTEKNCAQVEEKLRFLNATNLAKEQSKGSICNGDCCGVEVEALLRRQGKSDLANILRDYSRSLQGTLSTISTTLQKYIVEVSDHSENLTNTLLTQIYKTKPKEPIYSLYSDIKSYIQIEDSDGLLSSNVDIKTSVTNFFEVLFPIAYRQSIDSPEFNFDYKSCLRKFYHELQPFGEIPRQLGQALSKGLEATRLLFETLQIGIEVLNASEVEDDRENVECYDALTRMTYCPKCQGLVGHKPCSGYCLNVLRGCLIRYVAVLDAPWNSYVEGLERLVTSMKQPNNEAGVNAGSVIKGIDTKISDAIMYILKKKDEINNRVRRNCGPPKYSDIEKPIMYDIGTEVNSSKRMASTTRVFAQLPINQINNFLTSIAQSKNFYDNLAENLCKDDSFAETKDKKCWNGERIGEYTKTVVDASLDTQKYNPEVQLRSNIQTADLSIAAFADKLRHTHQTVISLLGGVNLPEADNYVQQGDEPDQGSGSGGGNIDDDDGEFSGSGEDPKTSVPRFHHPEPSTTQKPKTSGCSIAKPTIILFVAFVCRFWRA